MEGATRIRYSAGSEFAPDHPFGRTTLSLRRSGEATLDQARQGSKRAWAGHVEPAAFDAVLAHLRASGFPDYVAPPIPPSAHFTLTVEVDSGQRFDLTDSIYSKNQAVRSALAWLDAVVRQLSGDAIPVGPVRNQRLVLESREVGLPDAGGRATATE